MEIDFGDASVFLLSKFVRCTVIWWVKGANVVSFYLTINRILALLQGFCKKNFVDCVQGSGKGQFLYPHPK